MTSTRTLRISANEVVRLLRQEIASTNGQPELDLSISKQYIRKKAPRRRTRRAGQSPDFDLVHAVALLAIEPRREHDYWVLRVEVDTIVGRRAPNDDSGLAFSNLTIAEFDGEMRSRKDKIIRLRLETETPAARRHFYRWLAEMRKRHSTPRKKQASQPGSILRPPPISKTASAVNAGTSQRRSVTVTHPESVEKSALTVDRLLPLARKQITMLPSDAPLIQAGRLLARKEANLVIVCNSIGKMVGVVAKTDIVREFCKSRGSRRKLPTSAAMTRKVLVCRPSDLLVDVWSTMKTHGLKHIPIVDPDARPIGLVIARDLLEMLIGEAEYEEQLLREYVMGVGYR